MKRIISISFKRALIPFAFLLLTTITESVNAQEKVTGEISETYTITMNDGSSITGKLLSVSDDEFVFESGSMGKITLQKATIRSMNKVSSINNKKTGIWFENPTPTKYLLGSSALLSEPKTGYYANTWIFVQSGNYAFTKNLSLAGGFEIISILAGGKGPYAFYLNPKATFKIVKNLYMGANILYANTIRSIDEFGGLGTLNAFATYGTTNLNITAAIGWGWAEDEFSRSPLITISGMARASKRIAFVSENWLIPKIGDTEGYYGLYSYGIRFLGEKTSIDLAFINNPDIADKIIIGIPWLGFTIHF
jgi:hypothetical protein